MYATTTCFAGRGVCYRDIYREDEIKDKVMVRWWYILCALLGVVTYATILSTSLLVQYTLYWDVKYLCIVIANYRGYIYLYIYICVRNRSFGVKNIFLIDKTLKPHSNFLSYAKSDELFLLPAKLLILFNSLGSQKMRFKSFIHFFYSETSTGDPLAIFS